MTFTEIKLKDGYEYETEQFVGTFRFGSKEQISPSVLDSLVLTLSPLPSTMGKIQHKGQTIEYDFLRKDMWITEEDLLTNN